MMRFSLGIMNFVDGIYNEMIKQATSKISVPIPTYINTDKLIEYVKEFSPSFKYTISDGVITCEFISKDIPWYDRDIYIKHSITSMFKNAFDLIEKDLHHMKLAAKHVPDPEPDKQYRKKTQEELEEDGRNYLARYFYDHPDEFYLLINKINEFRKNDCQKQEMFASDIEKEVDPFPNLSQITQDFMKRRKRFFESIKEEGLRKTDCPCPKV